MATPAYTDNIDEVTRYWDSLVPRPSHEIVFENSRPYASYLHDKTGFWLFNNPQAMKTLVRILNETLIARGLPLNDGHIVMALDALGFEYIGWLQTKTGEMRPPVKAGQGDRQAYRGHWSDVTGLLVKAFSHSINGGKKTKH